MSDVTQSISLSKFGDEDFQLIAGTGSIQIAPGSFYSIEVKFDPVSVGKKSTIVLIEDDDDVHNRAINIVGTGVGIDCHFSSNDENNNFGLVRINSPEIAFYHIENNFGSVISGNITITEGD
ncbi:MAG: hypothetical protein U5Q03_18130 [Bacteroidota bacterium]|nr:hypothetical protein [Bacteroidota bacterium]